MSQVITNAFEQYWQSSLAAEQPVVLDEFILADIPNLDITSTIDPETGLPPESQIVHRQNVDQRGRINNNAVAYTIVMDTTVGDFSFNAMYLRNKQNGVIGMIVYKGRETKLKTDQTTGQTGNSLVKSMLMGYDQAAEATLTHVDAGTWQIDYAARLRGMDEDIRQLQADLYGHHTFVGDGFKVVEKDGAYLVSQGVAIIGGLRVELKAPEVIHPGTKPIGVWVDVHRAGSLLSEHQNHFTIITSVADLSDHVDESGYPHYVAKLGTVQTDSTVIDGRGQGGSGGLGAIPDTFALWKRSMAEAGYELIGQFGTKNTIENAKQVLLSKEGTTVYAWLGGLPKNVERNSTPENSGGIGNDTWQIITSKTLRECIKKLDGSLEGEAEWSSIPSHSDKDLSDALNAQAKALANRTTLLRDKCTLSIHAEDFRKGQEGVVRSDADTLIAALDFVVSQSNMLLPYEGELSNGISIDLGGRKYACHKVVKQTGGLKYGNVVFTNGCITWAPPLKAQAKVIEIGQQAGYVYQANFENVTFLQCQLNYRSALSSWVHGSCTFINCVDPITVDDGCHEIYVNGNLFRLTADIGGNKGIVFPADCRADGNVFVGYDIAIHLTQPSNIVSGNHFYGTRVGVKEDYSAGQNQIVFNQFDGCTLESDNSCGMGIISHNIFYAQKVYYAVLVKPKPGFSSHVSSRITNNTFNFYNTPDLTPKVGGSVTVSGSTVKAGDFEFKEKMVGAAIFSKDGNGTFINLGVIVDYVDSKTVTISKVKGLADGVYSVGVQPNAVCYHTKELPDPTFIPEFVIRDNNISNGVAINTGSILGRELSYNPALDHFQLIGKGIETNAYKAFKVNNVSAYSQFANIPDDTAFRAATSDGSGTWAAFGYDPTDNGGDGCFILRGGKSGNGGRYRGNALGFTPGNDNARTLGSATNRWSSVYASTGTINTSDVREKEIAEEFDDAVLDAWSEVRLIQYKWKSAINDKGTDARIHFGVGAQEVYAAFEKHGLNPFSYGVLCYDKWDESPAVYDEQGNEVTPAREAGDRWGVRADECAFLEMALQRRNHQRLLERLEALEA